MLAEQPEFLPGPASKGRRVRIMVTMPGEAADDYLLVRILVLQGMNCMRINCAHDDAAVRSRMIEHLKRAEHSLGRPCRVVMDLAGPKLRAGPLEPGHAVVRIRPERDDFGRVTGPARAGLTSDNSPQLTLTVVDVTDHGCWAEATESAYIVPGIIQRLAREVAHGDDREAAVGGLPARENSISLRQRDLLIVTRDQRPGRPAMFDSGGRILTPARIGCSMPEVFDDVRARESVWCDDG